MKHQAALASLMALLPTLALAAASALAAPAADEDPLRDVDWREWMVPLVQPDAPDDPNAPDAPGNIADRLVRQRLQPQQPKKNWLDAPFEHLEGEMAGIVNKLDTEGTGKPVQDQQQEVIRKLDTLIDLLEQASSAANQAAGGSTGVTARPTGPMADSQLVSGPGGMGDLHDPKDSDRKWADLPPREREKILQARTDGFPPGYEQLLEEYYRRLASEQALPADPNPPASDTPPTPEEHAE